MEGRVIGQYRVTGVLGEGGMGIVYAAEHTLLDRPAAVKVLLPRLSNEQEIVTRFFNEARAATAIQHPGIVEVYDFGWTQDGAAFIVMEYLRGETLRARRKRAQMRWSTALALVRQIAGALAAAHAKGIVHRDLKPDNIFLVPDPEVPGGERIKLLDFGIAKLAGTVPNRHKTQTGMMMGTPMYMAPEQCRGIAVDSRADLYALGCILFELCTGQPPFTGEGEGDVLVAHIHERPPTIASRVNGVPQEIESLVQRMLAKAPADRVQSADELIRLIDSTRAAIGHLARSGSHPILEALVPLDGVEQAQDSSGSTDHHVPKLNDTGPPKTLPERSNSRRSRRDAVAPAPGTEVGATMPATQAMPSSSRLNTTLSSATGSLQPAASHSPARWRSVIGIVAGGLASIIAAVLFVLLRGGGDGGGDSDNTQLGAAVSSSMESLPTSAVLPSPPIDTTAKNPPVAAGASPPPVVEAMPNSPPAVETTPSPPPVAEAMPSSPPVVEAKPSPPLVAEAVPPAAAPSQPADPLEALAQEVGRLRPPAEAPSAPDQLPKSPPAQALPARRSSEPRTPQPSWRATDVPITVTSTPPGATIKVDGNPFGRAPTTFGLQRDYDYKLEISLPGYRTQEFEIHLTTPVTKNVTLKRQL